MGRVTLSFDDSLSSVYSLAFPEMERIGIQGTVFVISDLIGKEYMGYPVMNKEELAELHRKGWEIGSHTKTHPRLSELSDDEVNEELKQSRETLESVISAPVTSLAYPYGDYDGRIVSLAARHYACARMVSCYPPLRVNRTPPRNRMKLNAMSSFEGPWTLPRHLFAQFMRDHEKQRFLSNVFPQVGFVRDGFAQERKVDTGPRSLKVKLIGKWIASMDNSAWLILCFHNISPNGSFEPYNTPLSEFREILKIVAERTSVSTLRDACQIS